MIEGAEVVAPTLRSGREYTVGFTFSIFSTRDGGTREAGFRHRRRQGHHGQRRSRRGRAQQPAILENNAIYYQLPPGVHDSDIQQVTATWSDGSTPSVPLHSHGTPPQLGRETLAGRASLRLEPLRGYPISDRRWVLLLRQPPDRPHAVVPLGACFRILGVEACEGRGVRSAGVGDERPH